MSGARIRWVRGGEARIVSISATGIVLRSTTPAPPGARLEGTAETDGREFSLRIKVHASKRAAEGEFLLQGKPLDLTRDVRHHLEAIKADDDLPPAAMKKRTEEAMRNTK